VAAGTAQASGAASRYASALFELAEAGNALDKVAGDLATLETMLEDSTELRQAMHSPLFSREAQADAVTALADKAGLDKLTSNFLGVLALNRRLVALPHIIASFRLMLAAKRGEVTAEVVSAVPLDEQQLQAVEASVRKHAGRAVQLKASVDPGLLGGLIVRIGSRMVDASLRTRLQQLELAMRGVG
jgi:F-type H+-transporting ATPase subunit delta